MVLGAVGGCAEMHHYQLGDIDSSRGPLQPFSVQVDETGFDLEEGVELAKIFLSERDGERAGTAQDIVSMFQFGPTTGDATLRDDWGDRLADAMLTRCPSGRVTGLSTTRETMDYPVVSGEVITIRGYCIQ